MPGAKAQPAVQPAQTAPPPGSPPLPVVAQPASAAQRPRGFLARLAELLGPGNQPERLKKRQLKNIAREVSRDRAGYYDAAKDLAGPGLAKVFHTLYRALGPAQTLLEAAGSSEALKNMVVESCLTPEELEVRDGLTQDGINQAATTLDTRRFAEKVKQDLTHLSTIFDHTRISRINERMRDFWVLLDLISFDYHGVLRKFDTAYPRSDFSYNPAFSPIDSGLVSIPLKDLLEIVQGLDTQADWDGLFDILKEYRKVDPVARDTWKKLLKTIEKLLRSEVLANVVRLIDHDPDAKVAPRQYLRRSAEDYLEKTRVHAEMAFQKQMVHKRTAQIDEMVKKTFGKVPEPRMINYTTAANIGFQKRGAAGYTHAQPLSYLRIYLDDHLESEVKSTIDLILVKGRWGGSTSSHSISETLRAALKLREDLAALDGSLGEEGPLGQKVKTALTKASRNKKDAYVLRQALRAVNDTAKGLLATGVQTLVTLGRVVKSLLDDHAANEPRIVSNWRELDTVTERQLKGRFVASYTRLYNLVQLLGQYRDVRTDE